MAVIIKSVTKGSNAFKHNILAGETLISINGNIIIDVLDYRFYQINTVITLVILDLQNNQRTVTFNKREYDEIGLEFDTYLMDEKQSCNNKCIFCFIDQLPKGMRESLYFKDDDSRLSFLFGNYITLTNITQHEIDRIIKMHISPMNVSVHTTNPKLRIKMMKNKNAGKALSILKQFASANIKINCQIVSCPNINDGEELTSTLNDLTALFPSIECVSIVPVGLTRYRKGLYPLTEYTKETALETLEQIEKFGDECITKFGKRIVFPADEFYLKAKKEIPDADFYEEFEQLENGVGILALLKDEFTYYLEELEKDETLNRKVTIATGTSVAPFLIDLFKDLKEKYPNLEIQTIAIQNNFFGGGVNVAGLVTGTDLLDQLKNVNIGDNLLIPSVMLRREGDIFLDDVSLLDVEQKLNTKVLVTNNSGEDLINSILGK